MPASRYSIRVEKLVERFSSLVKHTEKLAFPDYREGVLSREDKGKWNKLHLILYNITHAAFSIDDQNIIKVFVYLIWTYLSAFCLVAGLFFISPYLSNTDIQNGLSSLSYPTIMIFACIAAIMLIPPSIYWIYEITSKNKYPILLKIFIVLIFACLMNGFTQKILFSAPIDAWLDPKSGILRSFLFLIGPGILYLYGTFIDITFQTYYLFRGLLGGVLSIHNPLSFSTIKKLLLEEIPSPVANSSWHFSELSNEEIESLHKWASANRTATEKRTLPISISLGLIGLLTISSSFQSKADSLVNRWLAGVSKLFIAPFSLSLPEAIIVIGLLFLFLYFIMAFIVSLGRLFINLAIQNIIIEACIAAEFGNKPTAQKDENGKEM